MQSIPAARGANAPAAAEYVRAMGASGLPTSGLSFESVLAASVHTGHAPGKGGGQTADGAPGDTQGMISLRILSALRRKAGPTQEETPEPDYLLAGMLAQGMDTDIPQTDGTAQTDDAVAHILQGDNFQAPVGPMEADTPAVSPHKGSERADFSREMLARMPQAQTPQAQAADTASAAATDGGSCPLENVNDLIGQRIKTELDQLAARTRQPADQAADSLSAEALPESPRMAPRTEGPEVRADIGGQAGDSDTRDTETTDTAGMSRPLDIGALRAQGELQNTQPAAPKAATATTETLLDTMVERLSLERQGNSHQMEIQLRPEHLGKVTIQLTLDGTGVQAKIRTEDPGVRGLINSQVDQLIQSLEQKGVRLTAVDVTYQPPQEFGRQSSGGREQMSQENRNRGPAAQAVSKAGHTPETGESGALTMDTYVSQAAEGSRDLL